MICQACKDGAELYLKANALEEVKDAKNNRQVKRIREQANRKHGLCMNGSWCDCHHREPRRFS